MIVDDRNEVAMENSANYQSKEEGGFLFNLGPKRNRANTDHEDFDQKAEKKFKKFNNFTNLYKSVKSQTTEMTSNYSQDIIPHKLFLMSKMSTTTEVDLELEQKYSNLLDKEEDISAEFKELDEEIKNYALNDNNQHEADMKNEQSDSKLEYESSALDNVNENDAVYMIKQNSRSRYLSL